MNTSAGGPKSQTEDTVAAATTTTGEACAIKTESRSRNETAGLLRCVDRDLLASTTTVAAWGHEYMLH
jgi:hypothetical protein